MLEKVYEAYGLNERTEQAIPFGSGLINTTWKINNDGHAFILQQINHQVFKKS